MIKVAICDDSENIVNEIKAMLTECCNDFQIVADIYTYDKGKKLEGLIIRNIVGEGAI